MNAAAQNHFTAALASLSRPAPRKQRKLVIARVDDGREIARNYYGECALTVWNVGPWARDAVAREFECSADDLETIEDDDLGELVALNGKPLAYFVESFVEVAK